MLSSSWDANGLMQMFRIKSAHRTAGTLFMLGLVGCLLQYGFNVLLSSNLSKVMYGDFSLGLRTFILASYLQLLGTNNAAKRFLSRYLYNNKTSRARDYIIWNLRFILKPMAISTVLLFLGIIAMVLFHVFEIKPLSSYHIALYCLLFSPIGALAYLLDSYLQSNSNVYWSNFFSYSLLYLLLTALFALFVYVFRLSPDTLVLVFLVLVAFFLLALLAHYLFCLKSSLWVAKLLFDHNRVSTVKKKWRKTSLRLFPTNLMFLVFSNIDLYIVKFFARRQEAVGEYAAVLVLAGLFFTLSRSIFSFVTPRINKYFERDRTKLQKAINGGLLINLWVNVMLWVIFILFLKAILLLFGEGYYTWHTSIAAWIMMLTYSLETFTKPATLLLYYMGHEMKMMFYNVLSLIILVGVAIPLTLWYGIVGTAIATSAAIIFKSVLCLVFVRLKLGYKPLALV